MHVLYQSCCIATFVCSDLIGQDVVGGCAGFKRLARRVGHSRQLWQVH